MAIKPFEIQSPSLVLAGVQMQAGATGVVIPGVTQATTYSVNEVDDTGDQTQTFPGVPTVIDNGYYTVLNGGPTPSGYSNSVYFAEDLDGDSYITEIQVTEPGSFPASYQSTVTQNMWATNVPDAINNFNPSDWVQIPFAPIVQAGEIENVSGGAGINTYAQYNIYTCEYTSGNEIFMPGNQTQFLSTDYYIRFVDDPAFVFYQIDDFQYDNGSNYTSVTLSGDPGTKNNVQFWTYFYVTNQANVIPGDNVTFSSFEGDLILNVSGGGSGGSELVNGDESFVLDTDGNVVFQGVGPGDGVNRGLVWDYGANANGVNSEVRQDGSGITVRAYTQDGGGANGLSAPVNIVTNQDATEKRWVFDGTGNVTIPGSITGIDASDGLAFTSAITNISTGSTQVYVDLTDNVFGDPYRGQVSITDVVGTTEANGIWYYEATDPNQFTLYTDDTYSTLVDGTNWTGYISGGTATGITASSINLANGNVTLSSSTNYTWNFDTSGQINIPTGSRSFAQGHIQSANGYPTLLGYGSGSHGGPELDWSNSDDPSNFNDANVYRSTLYINDEGLYVGLNENNTAGNAKAVLNLDSSANLAVNLNGNTWTFTNTGGIVFPDTTVQTTAYQTAQQYGYFVEMNHPNDNNEVNAEAVAVDPGGNTYVSYGYYDNNTSENYGGVIKFNSAGVKQWAVNLHPNDPNSQYSRIVSLEYTTVSGTNYVVATGYYYNNTAGFDRGFSWLINPDDGTTGTSYDTGIVGSGYGIVLQDAVFSLDSGSNTSYVIAGNSYNSALDKTFTPLAPSTVDKLYISWSEFNNSGLQKGDQIIYQVNGYYGARVNYAEVPASIDGTTNSAPYIYLKVSYTEAGQYQLLGVNGWGGDLYNWSSPVALKILGSNLGGADTTNDLTFDFDPSIFSNNTQNLNAAVSNIAGTPITDVYCQAFNGKDWSADIGTPLTFQFYLNNQGYIARLGNTSWSKNLGGTDYERFNSVAVDSSDNIYAVGYFPDGISRSGLVMKYDINGTQQWAVYVDPDSNLGITIQSVDVLADGNIICVGDYGITTKLNSSTGAIIWQVKIDDYMSWNADFKGTATSDGDYIFANYEDNNYKMYVMKVSGTDGSVLWTKEISRYFAGTTGEIYPENDYDAQYIDCNTTHVTIGASSYIYLSGQDIYNGLVINIPIDGDNVDGIYEQYIIASYTFNWTTLSTTAVSATVLTQSNTESVGPLSPVDSQGDITDVLIPIGGGAVTTPPTKIENGNSWANIATADGNLVVSVNNDNMTWTFATDQVIYGKNNQNLTIATVDDGGNYNQIRQEVRDNSNNPLTRTALDNYSYRIETNIQGGDYTWNFTGNTLFTPQNGAGRIQTYNTAIAIQAMDAGGSPVASLQSVSSSNDPNVFSTFDATTTAANIKVYNGGSVGGTANTWTFDNLGNLTVPGTIKAKDSGSLTLSGGKAAPAGQFATSNGATYGYGGALAIFAAGDFTSGAVTDVQVGNVVVEANGSTANVITVQPGIAGPGTYGITIDKSWNQQTPYTWYAGYGPDGNVTIHAGTANWQYNSSTTVSPVSTYANLPAATTAGQRAFISDANLAASGNFGATVGGSGSNTVPVYSDGSNWRIG